jgi:hypothetical protein
MKGLLAVSLAALALAGCGGSDDSSTTTAKSSMPSTTAPAPAASSMAKLQQAASDVVLETSRRDEEAARRAFDRFNQLLAASHAAIESKGVQLAERIDNGAMGVGEALDSGDLGKASSEAKGLQAAVNAAATAMSGAQ